jgi:hypothetical protein
VTRSYVKPVVLASLALVLVGLIFGVSNVTVVAYSGAVGCGSVFAPTKGLANEEAVNDLVRDLQGRAYREGPRGSDLCEAKLSDQTTLVAALLVPGVLGLFVMACVKIEDRRKARAGRDQPGFGKKSDGVGEVHLERA